MVFKKEHSLFLSTLFCIGVFNACTQTQVYAIPVNLVPSRIEGIKYPIHIACECDYSLYVDGKYIDQANKEVNIVEIVEYGHPGWNATKKFYPIIYDESPKIIAFSGVGNQFPGFLNGFVMDMNNGEDYTKYQQWKCNDFSSTVTKVPPSNWITYDYDDNDWAMSASYGNNYQNNSFQLFEKEREGINLEAEWLWTSNNAVSNIYCRKKNENVKPIPVVLTTIPVQTSAPTRVSTTIHPTVTQTSAPTRVSKTIHQTVVQTHAPTHVSKTIHPIVVQTSAPTTVSKTIHPIVVQTSAPTTVSKTIHPTVVQTSAPTRVSTTIHPTVVQTHAPTHVSKTIHTTVAQTSAPTHVSKTIHTTVVQTSAPHPVQTSAPHPVQTSAPHPVQTSAPTRVQTSAPTRVSTTIHPTVTQTSAPTRVSKTIHQTVVQTSVPTRVQTSAPTRVSKTIHTTVVQTSAPHPVQTSAPTHVSKTIHTTVAQTSAPTRVQTSAPTRVQTSAPHSVQTSAPHSVQTSAPHRVSTTIHPTTVPAPPTNYNIVISPRIKIIIQNVKYSRKRSYEHIDNLFRKLKNYNDDYTIYKQLLLTRYHIRKHYTTILHDIRKLLYSTNTHHNHDNTAQTPHFILSMQKLDNSIKHIEQSIKFIKGNHKYILLNILHKLQLQYQTDTQRLLHKWNNDFN